MKTTKFTLCALVIIISVFSSGCNGGTKIISPLSSKETMEAIEMPPYPTAAATLQELIIDLSSNDPLVRIVSMDALEKYGDEASLAVPQLRMNLYYDDFSEVRWHAAIALGRLGSLAKEAVPDLISVFENDDDPGTVFYAIDALGNLGISSIVPRLATALYCDDMFNKQMVYTVDACYDYAISSADAISKLTDEHFTDAGTGMYTLTEDGTPLIVIDARKWWEEEGQYQDWSVP